MYNFHIKALMMLESWLTDESKYFMCDWKAYSKRWREQVARSESFDQLFSLALDLECKLNWKNIDPDYPHFQSMPHCKPEILAAYNAKLASKSHALSLSKIYLPLLLNLHLTCDTFKNATTLKGDKLLWHDTPLIPSCGK